jgi:hypothetical protein
MLWLIYEIISKLDAEHLHYSQYRYLVPVISVILLDLIQVERVWGENQP